MAKYISWYLHIAYPLRDGETMESVQDKVIDAIYALNEDAVMRWGNLECKVKDDDDDKG